MPAVGVIKGARGQKHGLLGFYISMSLLPPGQKADRPITQTQQKTHPTCLETPGAHGRKGPFLVPPTVAIRVPVVVFCPILLLFGCLMPTKTVLNTLRKSKSLSTLSDSLMVSPTVVDAGEVLEPTVVVVYQAQC